MEIEAIKASLDFHDLILVSAEPLEGMRKVFLKREKRGCALPVEPEDVEARVNPKASLSEAGSVFVAFEQTPFSERLPKPKRGYGRLAGISRARDYHHLLKEKLERLEVELKQNVPGLNTYLQVDTGPLYERGFAARTGRGYIGRNGNFIHTSLGSFVAIGLLVTSLESDFKKESAASCGSCTACIRACPGGALSLQGVTRPDRCRSWITQKRGELNSFEQEVMADWIYGCDICQQVCPKNRGIRHLFDDADYRSYVDLEAVMEESNRSFKRHYGHLSGAWRGAKQWKKNARYIRAFFQDREG